MFATDSTVTKFSSTLDSASNNRLAVAPLCRCVLAMLHEARLVLASHEYGDTGTMLL
jgi:hypothetical protein